MPTEVVMPQMGESIFEGTITKWLKKPGDRVEKDEPLFEISTDKVNAEIPSPVAGVLSEIKVAEGATVQINTVVAVVAARLRRRAQNRQRIREQQRSGPTKVTICCGFGKWTGNQTHAAGPPVKRNRCGDAADGRVDL